MPNHCGNNLEISADPKNKESLKQLKDFVKKSIVKNEKEDACEDLTFTFQGVVPMPKELDIPSPARDEYEDQALANIKKYGYSDWYEWRHANWGTKWDAYDDYIGENLKDFVCMSFDTAWAPPIPYYEALAAKYPLLTIEVDYYESGCDFAGKQFYEEGILIDEEEMTYGKWEFLENNDSWWEWKAEQAEEGDLGDLDDFKEHYGDIWEIMNDKDKKDIKKLIKSYKNEEANSES